MYWKLDDAISDCRKLAGFVVVARDANDRGAKTFEICPYNEYCWAIESEEGVKEAGWNHGYVVVMSSFYPYVDVDGTFEERMISEVEDAIRSAFGKIEGRAVYATDGNPESPKRVHMHFKTERVADRDGMKAALHAIDYVDKSVYSRHRCFRMPYASKLGKGLAKVPLERWCCGSWKEAARVNVRGGMAEEDDKGRKAVERICRISGNPTATWSDVRDIQEAFPGAKLDGAVMVLKQDHRIIRCESRYCVICEREHKTSRPYYRVGRDTVAVYCCSPHCTGFGDKITKKRQRAD
jgi:hypothetical protein